LNQIQPRVHTLFAHTPGYQTIYCVRHVLKQTSNHRDQGNFDSIKVEFLISQIINDAQGKKITDSTRNPLELTDARLKSFNFQKRVAENFPEITKGETHKRHKRFWKGVNAKVLPTFGEQQETISFYAESRCDIL
jgi:hypothetical protein